MSPRVIFVILLGLSWALPAGAESFKSWAARGAREEREKDYKSASSSYSNALSAWSDEDGKGPKAKVLCARAGLREKDGDDAGAIEDLGECLALDKKNAKAFHRRGVLLLKGGKSAPAISDFYKAVALDFGFAAAYADRARAYEAQGETAFAREDHKRACELGVKASCKRAKELAPAKAKGKAKKGKGKKKEDAPAEDAAPAPEDAPSEAAPPDAAEGDAPAEKPAKAKGKKKAGGEDETVARPKFKDCLAKLQGCVDGGSSFGDCVGAAVSCDVKAKKGCCPAACLKAYQKAVDREVSEAEAFRDSFSADSSCGVPPKEDEDD